MKLILLICLVFFSSTVKCQTLTQEQVDTCCRALSLLMESAYKNKQYDKMVVYYNAYEAVEPRKYIRKEYAVYFDIVIKKYLPLLKPWVITATGEKPIEAGGFVHLEGGQKNKPIQSPKGTKID